MECGHCESVNWQRVLMTVGIVMLCASRLFAVSPKIAMDLRGKATLDRVNVIVQFTKTPTARHHQKVFSKGGTLNRELGLVKAGAYSIPASALVRLAADPEVAYISPERPLFSTSNGSPTAVLDYHTETVNASAAWDAGLNGTGIGVAVIDSGIIDIPDLHGQNNLVVASQNFASSASKGATDQYGHGSHVAGIIAGTGKNSQGSKYFYTFRGISNNVQLIDLRVLDQNGAGTDSQVIAAIQTAIQLSYDVNGCLAVTTAAELYNPATGTWTSTGAMRATRMAMTGTVLPNGKALVAGGQTASSDALSSSELYNPATGTFSLTSRLITPRSDHTATLLPNGRVLMAGGEGVNGLSLIKAELYNPVTGTYSTTGNMPSTRQEHTAVLRPNGTVLVAGGKRVTLSTTTVLASCAIYNPATGTWTTASSMVDARVDHTATLLHNGHVLAAGGENVSDELSSAELF